MSRLIDADELVDTLADQIKANESDTSASGMAAKEVLKGFIGLVNGLPTASDWDRYSTALWREAYERGKRDAQPTAQSDETKYEYHYDHTDCIWYRPEARNRCPVTCAQYRDGWNDAMNYIFRDGKGYRPYKRDKQYGE